MQKVLRDEKPHPSLQTLLEWFQEDEEGQVKNHEKSVAKKDIHSSTLTERRALRTIGTFIAVSMLDDNEKAASLDFG